MGPKRVEHWVCKRELRAESLISVNFGNVIFSSHKAGVNKGEQGESNAEGMGCTQQELQQPCSLESTQLRFILVFNEKTHILISEVSDLFNC